MKKNLMSLAVAASVAGATTAQAAMYLDHEGTGEVLLFPYYNAVGTNESSFHIVNTTDDAKAVKVRILEYINSQEVLDFNLYLSAKDHFSFTIFQHPDANNGALVTRDESCTVPRLGTETGLGQPYEGFITESGARIQPFLPYQYQKQYDGLDFQARSQVGHIEVIEMGTLYDEGTATTAVNPKAWATHDSTGVPANCDALLAAWDPITGAWTANANRGVTVASGGLYGLSNVLDSQDAAAFGIEPAAIDDFWGTAGTPGGKSHTEPGSILPSLGEGDTVAIIDADGGAFTLTYGDPWDAVSSLFMSDELYNDVMINPNVGGMTDWIVTFPTKKNYVNTQAGASNPFGEIFKHGSKAAPEVYEYANLACEPMEIDQWNREESVTIITGKPQFSPKPPQGDPDTYAMCLETNTLAMGAAGTASVTGTPLAVEKSEYLPASNLSFKAGETEGWMRMGFKATHQWLDATDSVRAGGTNTNSTSNARLNGLPAMGFAAFKYANGDRSYGFVSEHKSRTSGSAIHS
jgi:hypothetical protein